MSDEYWYALEYRTPLFGMSTHSFSPALTAALVHRQWRQTTAAADTTELLAVDCSIHKMQYAVVGCYR